MTTHQLDRSSRRELRAVERSVFRKKIALWGGLVVVVGSLIVLLVLQALWLADLEAKTEIARKALLRNVLDAVAKDVHVYYLKISERALNLPPEAFEKDTLKKAGHFFKKKEIQGAQRLFMVSYPMRGKVLFFEPGGPSLVVPDYSDESLAVWAATAPWQILVKKGAVRETTHFSVDERDPDHRIIINPITDEKWKIVGLAGLIVDRDFFVDQLLPKAIHSSLHDLAGAKDLLVSVYDDQGRQVFPEEPAVNPKKALVARRFQFVFGDWTIGIHGKAVAREEWARTSFVVNMTLSAALAVLVVIGLGLAMRTASREMRLSTMKNDFVSNVSHELRTPISSIRVFGEFMRLGRVRTPEKIREYGAYIEAESRRLTQLINNILDFSKIEGGRRVYAFAEADLESIVRESLETFGVRLHNTGIEVELKVDGPIPPIDVDANAVDLAVANLLDNAVKYANNSRRISVQLKRVENEVVITVEDFGIGIPRDELEKIFERFHRVNTGLVHDVRGSGLGLALVRHIAEAHGGSVSVESEVGVGSIFSLHLPVHEDSP